MARIYGDNGYYSRRNTRGRLHGGVAGMGQCSWLTGADGSFFWGEQLPNGSIESCPSGGPPTAPPTSPSNTAGQNIVNQYSAYADLPYLNSPQYIAAEAAASGQPVPSQAAGAQSTLQTYCAQNALNNTEFGTPLDTMTCAGGAPLPIYMTEANALVPATPSATVPPTPAPTTNALQKSAAQTGSSPITTTAINQQNQGVNPNTNLNGSQPPAPVTCSGLGIGACIGPLDAGTWGLIAAGVILVLMLAGGKH